MVERRRSIWATSLATRSERVPYLGETRAWIGDATCKRLDRASVVILVGGEVQ